MIITRFGLISLEINNGGDAIRLSNLGTNGHLFNDSWSGFFFTQSLVVTAYEVSNSWHTYEADYHTELEKLQYNPVEGIAISDTLNTEK